MVRKKNTIEYADDYDFSLSSNENTVNDETVQNQEKTINYLDDDSNENSWGV